MAFLLSLGIALASGMDVWAVLVWALATMMFLPGLIASVVVLFFVLGISAAALGALISRF